jgi:hypothetical protein
MFARNAALFGAMSAAIDLAICFHAVTDHVAVTMGTFRRERVDRALEAIERMAFAASDNFKGFFVIVAANFTNGHDMLLPNRDVRTINVKMVLQLACRFKRDSRCDGQKSDTLLRVALCVLSAAGRVDPHANQPDDRRQCQRPNGRDGLTDGQLEGVVCDGRGGKRDGRC